MSKKGLKKWFDEKWVDISAKKPGGGYKECGRKSASGSSRGYPKCVPAAKAARMSEGEKRSAVARKRSAANTGPKPTNVKTKIKKMQSGAMSTVNPNQDVNVMEQQMSEMNMLDMNTISKGITPYIEGSLQEDSFGKTTRITPGVQIGTDKVGGLGVDLYADLEKTETQPGMFGPGEKDQLKSFGIGVQNKYGRVDYRQNQRGGKSGSFRFSKTFNYSKGGMNKHSTINQEDTYVGTGGFADSNYQQQVKKLLEE